MADGCYDMKVVDEVMKSLSIPFYEQHKEENQLWRDKSSCHRGYISISLC